MSAADEASIVIDARGMVPPEPLERTLEALDWLGEGDTLLLIIPRHPAPLLDMLDQNGFVFTIETRDDGCFGIRIRPKP